MFKYLGLRKKQAKEQFGFLMDTRLDTGWLALD
jgi:aspartyl-tRNA synthetase